MKRTLIVLLTLTLTGCTTTLAAPSPSGLRQVHSPGIITVDEHLVKGQCHVITLTARSGAILPDPACTPGAIDPAVTQATINTTICKRGWTATIRPPLTNSAPNKRRSLTQYGITTTAGVEYDHLVPLELGGANSTSNLWPEPNRTGATSYLNPKDNTESTLRAAVCKGKTTLAAAQNAIATNWTTARKTLGL